MKYKYIDRESLMKDIPHIIEYLESVDRRLSNVELVIRDTDHTCSSLRLESEGELSSSVYEEVCKYVKSHCCICGSCHFVREADNVGYDCMYTYGSPPFEPYLCANCYEKLYRDKVDAITLVKFQIKRCAKEGDKYKAPHKKVRLLTTDDHIVYRFINEIFVVGDKYFITSQNQESKKSIFSFIKSLFYPPKRELVTILGVDTGKRDVNDERIYTGDVLLVKHNQYEYKWFAEILGYNGVGFGDQKSYWWLYDGDNFPIPFREFEYVEIVGHLRNESMWGWREKNKDFVEATLRPKNNGNI